MLGSCRGHVVHRNVLRPNIHEDTDTKTEMNKAVGKVMNFGILTLVATVGGTKFATTS